MKGLAKTVLSRPEITALMVMIVLVLFARRASLPAALGLPYVRGQR